MNKRVVSQGEWEKLQKEFIEKEKALSEATAELAEARRKLPWVKVEKQYVFKGPQGKISLSDLFQGRPQLIVQHFMFAPEWSEGCPGCSVQADSVDGARYHFEPKGISFAAISRAPIEKIESFKRRMGWKFNWVSSGGTDFNYDFHVSFTEEQVKKTGAVFNYEFQKVDMQDLPAVSVFYKNDQGEIFRTYSNYSGNDDLLPVYGYLDITPLGRNEKTNFDWIKHHDKY